MTQSEFEHIAQQLRSQMLKVALDFFGSQDDAEDVAQDALVQLWRYCEQIDGGRNISGLAVRVAKNCCVNLYRKRQATNQRSYTDIGPRALRHPDTSDSPQELLEADDTRRMMTEVVALLKPREHQLFEMRQTMELSTEQISEQTGIPKASVTAMVSAARKKVFTELKRRMKQ
ncbi:MAG: sigma-70 family RNA polymerase sigma factor [Prevotella sp.]|nr:sigma-70 family RNA polymerase sigma factor [Prevotella sp.]MBO7128934.1 sigma-70 family RNA polymerase sigma factor [Prevotella sp.]